MKTELKFFKEEAEKIKTLLKNLKENLEILKISWLINVFIVYLLYINIAVNFLTYIMRISSVKSGSSRIHKRCPLIKNGVSMVWFSVAK